MGMFWVALIQKYTMSALFYALMSLILYLYLNKREWSPRSCLAVRSWYSNRIGCWGAFPGRRLEVSWGLSREAVIGRDSSCDIVIPDAFVSSRHARVYASGEDYFVEDLGSVNGTLINVDPSICLSGCCPATGCRSAGRPSASIQLPRKMGTSVSPSPPESCCWPAVCRYTGSRC